MAKVYFSAMGNDDNISIFFGLTFPFTQSSPGVAASFMGAYNTLKSANLLSSVNQPQIVNWFDGEHLVTIIKSENVDDELHGFELTVPASDLSQGAYSSQPRPSRSLRFIHVADGILIKDPIILRDVIIHRNCILVGVTSLELRGKVQLPDYLISSKCPSTIQPLSMPHKNTLSSSNVPSNQNETECLKYVEVNIDDVLFKSPLLINKGELTIANLSIEYTKDDTGVENINKMIENHGSLELSLSDISLDIGVTIIENVNNGLIHLDNGLRLITSSIKTEERFCLIKLTNPMEDTRINIEDVDFNFYTSKTDVSNILVEVNDSGLVNDQTIIITQSKLINKPICDDSECSDFLITNTTNYRFEDNIVQNMIVPDCFKTIKSYYPNVNKNNCIAKPNIQTLIDGATLNNTTIIIPPTVVRENIRIDDITSNGSSIYYIDANDNDILFVLPLNPTNGYMLTIKRIDHSEHNVRIKSRRGNLIENKSGINLNNRCNRCNRCDRFGRLVTLHFFDKKYYILNVL